MYFYFFSFFFFGFRKKKFGLKDFVDFFGSHHKTGLSILTSFLCILGTFLLGSRYRMLVFVFLLKFLVGGGLDMIPDITRIFFLANRR